MGESVLHELIHIVCPGSRPPVAVQPRQCIDNLGEGQRTFIVGRSKAAVHVLLVDLTALAMVVCAFRDPFTDAPHKRLLHFRFQHLSALPQWYFRDGRDAEFRRIMNVAKSSKSEALADSLLGVVVVILESISIGLEDDVPDAAFSRSWWFVHSYRRSQGSGYCCHRLCHVGVVIIVGSTWH